MNTDEDLARLEELLRLWRSLAWNNERHTAAWVEVARQLARDVLQLVDVSPTDPLLPTIIREARERSQKVMANIGDAERAH
jgi:hypothetical protein